MSFNISRVNNFTNEQKKQIVDKMMAQFKEFGLKSRNKIGDKITANIESHHQYVIDDLFKPGDLLEIIKPSWELSNKFTVEIGKAKVIKRI